MQVNSEEAERACGLVSGVLMDQRLLILTKHNMSACMESAHLILETAQSDAIAEDLSLPLSTSLSPNIPAEAFKKVLNAVMYGSVKGQSVKVAKRHRGDFTKPGDAFQIKLKQPGVGCSANGSMTSSCMRECLSTIAELAEVAVVKTSAGLSRLTLSAEAEPTQQDKKAWYQLSRLRALVGLNPDMLDRRLKARYLDMIGATVAEDDDSSSGEHDLPDLTPVATSAAEEWTDVRLHLQMEEREKREAALVSSEPKSKKRSKKACAVANGTRSQATKSPVAADSGEL